MTLSLKTNRNRSPNSRRKHESPKFTKPSRRTLFRIRYYEFKIHLSDFGLRILRLLDRATFHVLTSNPSGNTNMVPTATVTSCETVGSDKACSKSNDDVQTGSERKGLNRDNDIQSELEPGEIPTRNTKRKYKHRGRSRDRKRRSSLTRKKRPSEGERSTSRKSSIVGSGDIHFSESDPDKTEGTKLELKRSRRRSRKGKKLFKGQEVSEEIESNKQEEKEPEKESSVPQPPKPPPPTTPSKFQIQLEKAYQVGETKAKGPKKTLWELLHDLSHRTRSRRSLDKTKKVFQVGFKMGLPAGNIRGRASIRNHPVMPPPHPRDHLGVSIYSKPLPTVYYGVRRSSTALNRPPQETNDNFRSKYLPAVDKIIDTPSTPPRPPGAHSFSPSPLSTSLLQNTPPSFPSTSSSPVTRDVSSIPKTFNVIERILARIPIALSNQTTQSITQSQPPTFSHSHSPLRDFSPRPNHHRPLKSENSVSADFKRYQPQTAFTAQFYNLLNQNSQQ